MLDTNIVVAGLLWNGPPRRLIEWAIEGEAVELFSSPVLLDELAHTLGYSKFAGRIEMLWHQHRGTGGAVHGTRLARHACQRAARGGQ